MDLYNLLQSWSEGPILKAVVRLNSSVTLSSLFYDFFWCSWTLTGKALLQCGLMLLVSAFYWREVAASVFHLWISWFFPSQMTECCSVLSFLHRNRVLTIALWIRSLWTLMQVPAVPSPSLLLHGSSLWSIRELCNRLSFLITMVLMLTKAAVIFRSVLVEPLPLLHAWGILTLRELHFLIKCLLQLCAASHLFHACTETA